VYPPTCTLTTLVKSIIADGYDGGREPLEVWLPMAQYESIPDGAARYARAFHLHVMTVKSMICPKASLSCCAIAHKVIGFSRATACALIIAAVQAATRLDSTLQDAPDFMEMQTVAASCTLISVNVRCRGREDQFYEQLSASVML